MSWKRYALAPIVLVLSTAAHAQNHNGQAGHHNAAGPHAGGAGPGHPQQHGAVHPEQHMWNQWYMEQMMLNEMMGGSRRARSHQQGATGRGAPSQSGRNQPAQSQASGKSRPANHEGEKTGANHSESEKKAAHNRSHATQKPEPRTAKKASRNLAASDQSIISLLRTTHTRLAKADHDYQGHRREQ